MKSHVRTRCGRAGWFYAHSQPGVVSHYAGRLLNIHPSLLPKYPDYTPIVRRWKMAMKSTVHRAFRHR